MISKFISPPRALDRGWRFAEAQQGSRQPRKPARKGIWRAWGVDRVGIDAISVGKATWLSTAKIRFRRRPRGRDPVERFFSKLKYCRIITTRFERRGGGRKENTTSQTMGWSAITHMTRFRLLDKTMTLVETFAEDRNISAEKAAKLWLFSWNGDLLPARLDAARCFHDVQRAAPAAGKTGRRNEAKCSGAYCFVQFRPTQAVERGEDEEDRYGAGFWLGSGADRRLRSGHDPDGQD
ncbi:hypothetical protein [Rhodoblastus sp.]|uniref:hypothetical protein n=1 Tax=Rhodoblastus sp. TaxID=1962975 RepID=UPI003F946B7B